MFEDILKKLQRDMFAIKKCPIHFFRAEEGIRGVLTSIPGNSFRRFGKEKHLRVQRNIPEIVERSLSSAKFCPVMVGFRSVLI